MSSASEPPYPPGRQAPPAALPARRARALPAALPPAESGDEVDGARSRAAVQRTPPDAAGPVASRRLPTACRGGPRDRDQFRQDLTGRQGGRRSRGRTSVQDGYGPGAFGGTAGAPGAVMPGGYPGAGPGYPGRSRATRDSSLAAQAVRQASTPRATPSHLRSGNRAATPGSVPLAGISTSRQPASPVRAAGPAAAGRRSRASRWRGLRWPRPWRLPQRLPASPAS